MATKKEEEELLASAVKELENPSAALPQYKENENLAAVSDKLLSSVLNRENFSYDMNNDALYNQYKELYTQQGKTAAENVYGLNTSLTGGYGNSYASSAATAAFNEYMSRLNEKAAELEQTAYDRFTDKQNSIRDNLSLVQSLQESDYQKYRDSVSDYFSNEQLNLNKENLALNKANQALDEKEFDAERKNEEISLAFKAAEKGDYSLLSNLGIDVSAVQNQAAFNEALQKAELGDYSALALLGVDTSGLVYKDALETARTLAEYGDYSGLEALGIDISALQSDREYDLALQKAELGDYSGLEALGVNVEGLIYKDILEIAQTLAKYGDYSGFDALGIDYSDTKTAKELETALEFAKLGDYSLLEKFGFNVPEEEPQTEKISVTIQNAAQEALRTGGMAGLQKYLDAQIAYGQLTASGKQTIIRTLIS